jgi:GNAT superfamily N-acetyltransferase
MEIPRPATGAADEIVDKQQEYTCDHTELETPSGVVRVALPADHFEMRVLQIDCARGLAGVHYSLEEMERWIARIESTPQPKYGEYNSLVHVDAGKITAFIAWSNTSDAGHINYLYTDNVNRRRGIASSLLHLAEENLANKHVTLDSTINAWPFYEKRGYTFVEYPPDRLFKVATLEKYL